MCVWINIFMNTKYIPKRQVYEFAVCINIFMKLSKFLSSEKPTSFVLCQIVPHFVDKDV